MTNTERPALGKLTIGQPVMVRRSSNDSRRREPAECYIPAVITKAARVWVEMGRPNSPAWSRWRMRRDTQDEATQYSGSNASFATLEQHEWDKTQAWAREFLRDQGIRLDRESAWSGREVALADLIVKNMAHEIGAEA